MASGNTKKYRFSATLDAWLGNVSKSGRSRKQLVSVGVDSILIILSLWAAYSLRHGLPFSDFRSTWYLFLVLPVVTVMVFMSLGIYRWVIRSSNKKLFGQLLKGCFASSLLLIFLMYFVPPDRTNPRSLFVIYGLLLVCGTCGVRLIWQSLFDANNSGEPVAIYGSGDAGQLLLHSLAQGADFRPVLFFDDDPTRASTTIGGLPVVIPETSKIQQFIDEFELERVILAMPSISAENYHSKISLFKHTNIPVQTIPSHAELVSGNYKANEIRDLSIGDLLGRAEVPPDDKYLSKCVSGKVVLVTGGGGSIGSELCRQIIQLNPAKLVVLDQSETNLYQITEELNRLVDESDLNSDLFVSQLCSVNNQVKISEVIRNFQVSTVYHAAAYKHVPIIEAYPEEGVEVNVFGTLSVLDASIMNKVENFVLISTDKAVRPTNSMGASKRTAELILQAKAHENSMTKISMVRFGNVLGSSGSVVPKFKKQIECGGPITITHPEITRYFMTIPEAAQLVLQASAIAKGGDVFVLDMGEPIKIIELASSMVTLAGKKLQSETGDKNDIEIVFDGLRPGEKMFEELFINGKQSATVLKKVFAANEAWMRWEHLSVVLDEMKLYCQPSHRTALRKLLIETALFEQAEYDKGTMIPEKYKPVIASEKTLITSN